MLKLEALVGLELSYEMCKVWKQEAKSDPEEVSGNFSIHCIWNQDFSAKVLHDMKANGEYVKKVK